MNNKVHIFFENKQLNPDFYSQFVPNAIEDEWSCQGDFWFFKHKLDVRKGDRIFLARAKNARRNIPHPDIYASGWVISDAASLQGGLFRFCFQVDYIFDPCFVKPFYLDVLSEPLSEKLAKRAVDTTLDEKDAARLEKAFEEWLSSNRKIFYLRRYALSAWTLYNEGGDRRFFVKMYSEVNDEQMALECAMVSVEGVDLFISQIFSDKSLLLDMSHEDIMNSTSVMDFSLGLVADFMQDRNIETMEELVDYFKEIFFAMPEADVEDVLEENGIDYEIQEPDDFDDEFDDGYYDLDGEWDDDLSLPPFLPKNRRPQN